jgi:hypothetical protein
MKTIASFILSLIFSQTVFSQEIEFGKYRLCYDMYWRCHFQNLLELKSDSTYEFIYLDDTQIKKTQGTWKIDSSFVELTPFIIPDTIQITDVFETLNKKFKMNLISVSESYKGIPKLNVNCFINGEKKKVVTDSLGEIYYEGEVIDSLTISIKGRELKVIPMKNDTPSITRITVDTDYKDLVYQQLGINKIMIRNGKMMVKYKDGEDGELKTEYFIKIE